MKTVSIFSTDDIDNALNGRKIEAAIAKLEGNEFTELCKTKEGLNKLFQRMWEMRDELDLSKKVIRADIHHTVLTKLGKVTLDLDGITMVGSSKMFNPSDLEAKMSKRLMMWKIVTRQ